MMRCKLLSFLLLTLSINASFAQKKISPPEKNFEVFWQTFYDNYAFFDLKKMDWQAAYKKYRPSVNAKTSEDSLFAIMVRMVTPLHDSHINVMNVKQKKKFNAGKSSQFRKEFSSDSLRNAFWHMCDSTLSTNQFGPLKGYGSVFKGKKTFYFTQSPKYGYLRLARCFAKLTASGDLDEKDFEMNLLDSLLAGCQNLDGFIIDIRENIGGDDQFSYEVAGRFTSANTTGHYKQRRISATNTFTSLEKWILKPTGAYPFKKPVIILTNDKTVSAADVLALCMKQLPQVQIVGENSEGCYSDMFEKELPNGWVITLSNEKYYSPKMICYEGTGTPVDVVVKNSKQDLTIMNDPVIEKAIHLLDKK